MIFRTTDSKYKTRNGEKCKIVRSILEADDTHDLEVLPMRIVKFDDRFELEVWDDELEDER